jgi:RNA polymerase sigma-70 factor (ECF subfamily)
VSLATVPVSLLVACQSGDRDAFERLYGLIHKDLYRIVYSFMRDHDDTDEVLQESLIRFYRHFGSLKKVEKFASWAMRILVNQCQTHRSRKGRHAYTPIEETTETDRLKVMFQNGARPSPRDSAIGKETIGLIHRAISGLPERQRMAILLFEIQGLSIKESSEAMQCSEGAVKFNIHQARKKLQKSLAGEWRGLQAREPKAQIAPAVEEK